MKKIIFLFLILFWTISVFNISSAATPTVNSFSASRSSAYSRQPLSFSWNTSDGGIPKILFSCPAGVRLVKTDGTAFSCNVSQKIGEFISDGVDFIVSNVSGGIGTLVATLVPEDFSGVSYPELSKSVSVYIYPDPDPITEFSSSVSTSTNKIASFVPVTVSWSSYGTTGVNMRRVCSSNIVATSSSFGSGSTDIPCNVNIFSTDLPNSGNVTFYFHNKSNANTDFKLVIIPAMEGGMYDGGHSETLEFSVEPYVSSTFSVQSFSASGDIVKGIATTFSWATSNSNGLNIKSSCLGNISIIFNNGSTTKESRCGEYLFTDSLENTGSALITFGGDVLSYQLVTMTLIPKLSNGTYDATASKSFNFIVYQKPNVTNLPTPSYQPSNQSTVPASPSQKVQFFAYIAIGSRGTEVTKLQNFFKNYPDLYPEGLVTGYFGPATDRAVKRFQEKYNIAKIGVAGYGVVGPKTRAKLNEF